MAGAKRHLSVAGGCDQAFDQARCVFSLHGDFCHFISGPALIAKQAFVAIALIINHHQVICVDHFVTTTIPQRGFNFTAFVTFDFGGVSGAVTGQAMTDNPA